MTANEVYNLPVQEVSKSIYGLEEHMPECNYLDFDKDEVEGIEVRTFHYENFDGERGWHLQGVFLDGKPFMITQNAGRGGCDHSERFITDGDLYIQAVKRIQGNRKLEGIIDPNQDIPELTDFYGNKLEYFYDPTLKPLYKVGDIVTAMVLENPWNYSNTRIPTRVQIKKINPTHPRYTYEGKQLDRLSRFEPGKPLGIEFKVGEGSMWARFNDGDVLNLENRLTN